MNQIEDIFFESDFSASQPPPQQNSRIKMGEVFQLPNERYALVCIHCSEEFQYFSEFTLHVQDHLSRLKPPQKDDSQQTADFNKEESEIDGNKQDTTIESRTITQEPKVIESIEKIAAAKGGSSNLKEDDDYSDDDFNNFLDVGMDEDDDNNQDEEEQSTSTDTKETVLRSIRKTKSIEKPKLTKRQYKKRIKPNAVTDVYEELLAKYVNSAEDPMDPVKFEIFKADKVDGLFPCSIKDTPEVRMLASFSVHSYKFEKLGKEYLCPVCKSTHPNPASVRRHIFTHVKERVLLCGFCPEKFRAIRYLRGHLKQKHHNESRSFECFLCHKEFTHQQFRAMKDHIQSHQFANLHCMLCYKKFKQYRFYQLHMMNIHPQGICLKNESQQTQQEPIDYHEKPVITTYECYLCRKDFRERRLLRSHMKLHVQQPRLCLVCGIFCSSATSLSRHMKLHDSDETKSQHLCNICGKGFKIRQYLLRHNRKEHQLWADNQEPICQICGAYFDKKSLLHAHMKTHPFEETRNFICSICNHAARNAYNLRRHMQTHSNDRSFECSICKKRFHPRYAKDHMKSHTESRKHKCPDCGKKFKRKYALKQHSFQHGGAPEHKCDICGRAFARTDKLLRHRRRHGIPLNYHCKICLKGFISQKSYLLHESSHMKSSETAVVEVKPELLPTH
ncbi:PR domain zinc finger protein 5-like [Sitodiplosis mosellana]|uniref:PR domain zinc finger protein 5-like n=1 Tax=Sitodiplosis mosellana TaxID=263140 RepID=UPI002443B68C|nr:PR domain zinc finger protein 5-like [Sitodiplosis mosellana]